MKINSQQLRVTLIMLIASLFIVVAFNYGVDYGYNNGRVQMCSEMGKIYLNNHDCIYHNDSRYTYDISTNGYINIPTFVLST